MVQKGQQVLYCVYGMHRRKDLYGADAEEFRPERWGHRRQGWDFLPFNGGARNCIGRESLLFPKTLLVAETVIKTTAKC